MSFTAPPALGDLSVAELEAAVLAADAAVEQAAAARALALAELDRRTGGMVPEGSAFVPVAAWLRHRTVIGPGLASATVSASRLLQDAPATAAALAEGRVRIEQALTVARGLAALDDRELAAAAEPVWLEYAEESEPQPLRRRLRTWVAEHAPERFERDEEAAHDRRRVRLTPDVDGMFRLGGLLDGASAAVVAPVIEALARRKTEDSDRRSWPQKMCDALVEVCDRVMRHDGDLPLFGGIPPQVTVVVNARTRCGESPVAGPLPRWLLESLCCDADVSRVVLDPSGVVLDAGRTSRLVNPSQRRALVARDRGCVVRGCGRAPAWCDAHHLVAWEDGGLTDLNNLVLMCRRHHVMWHQGLIGLEDLEVPWLWALVGTGRPPPESSRLLDAARSGRSR